MSQYKIVLCQSTKVNETSESKRRIRVRYFWFMDPMFYREKYEGVVNRRNTPLSGVSRSFPSLSRGVPVRLSSRRVWQ